MKELDVAIKAMSKAKTVDEKVVHSQIVKNLTEALGIFLDLTNHIMETGLLYSDDYCHSGTH